MRALFLFQVPVKVVSAIGSETPSEKAPGSFLHGPSETATLTDVLTAIDVIFVCRGLHGRDFSLVFLLLCAESDPWSLSHRN